MRWELLLMKRFISVIFAGAVLVMATGPGDLTRAQSIAGLRVFETKCASCHQGAREKDNNSKAPDASTLRQMTAESVFGALARAPHAQMGLAEDDKRLVAAYLGGRKIGVSEAADAKAMPNRCANNPPLGDIARAATWN